jgi:hypothetical protein
MIITSESESNVFVATSLAIFSKFNSISNLY